jgi:hypothetical protein
MRNETLYDILRGCIKKEADCVTAFKKIVEGTRLKCDKPFIIFFMFIYL